MKKIAGLFLTVILLSMICACGQEDVDNIQISTTEESDIIQEAEINVPIEVDTDTSVKVDTDTSVEIEPNAPVEVEPEPLSEEEQSVYETYVAADTYDGKWYAYFDYDYDGKQELYIRGDTYGRVWKYVDGGLKKIDSGNVSEENINGLEWKEREKGDLADSEEWVHEGVFVYVSQNPFKERDFWYVDEEDFLSQYGFAESTPFYEYALPDDSVRLVLYYDEATGLGCGLRYFQRDPSDWTTSGIYGFSFMGAENADDSWMDKLNVDYTKFESWLGDTVSSWSSCEEEIIEYDDAGRVAHYEANGTMDGYPVQLLSMYYEYDDNGTLRQRRYYHYHLAFSSTSQTWYSYFDELGRLAYESQYITHGWLEYYYIYKDGSGEPAYGLFLDDNCGTWMPEFVQF